MQRKRVLRIRELLLRMISEIVSSLKDPRIGFLTITDVTITDDLREAKIFYSVLGNQEERNKTAEALVCANSFIRREIASRTDLRRVPELEFVYDESLAQAQRINEILYRLEKEKNGTEDKEKQNCPKNT
ncbi:MAG TPA: 30S ribosome-binding factor RbfA [Elusimicrobia bacterium]|jgi:ribosome-binding factor A|nr:30S ribosome-binding factor RbfA [Elusimicrobiota bacterium]